MMKIFLLKQKLKGCLSLLRVPNIFTVPGDVILGYIIAESFLENSDYLLGFLISKGEFATYAAIYILISVVSLYMFGLVTNDIADFDEDLEKRQERPIPSGVISKKEAWILAIFLLFTGLLSAKLANQKVFLLVILLASLIYGYNYLFKKSPLFGPLILGLCRALSIGTGFLASGISISYYPPMLYITCFIWFLYFFGVSLIAYHETENVKSVRGNCIILFIPLLWLMTTPFGSGSLGVILLVQELPPGIFLGIGSLIVFSLFILKNFIILSFKSPELLKTEKNIGELIRSIIFLQASGCAFLGYPYIALTLFLLWFPARFTSRRFYSS